MKNLTLRSRIVVSFAIILALMMVTATVAYTRLMRIDQLTSGIENDILPGFDRASQMVVDRIANFSLAHEYALEPDVVRRQRLKAALQASRTYMETLMAQYAVLITSPAEQQVF